MEHHRASAPHVPGLGVYAAEIEIRPSDSASEETSRQLLTAFVEQLAGRAVADGARVVGHIKAILQSAGGGYLYASVTSGHEAVRCNGELSGEHAELKLAVNALVFGVERDRLRRAVRTALVDLSHRFGFRFEISDSSEGRGS